MMQKPEPTDGPLMLEELQLAGRNRGMPLEALRYDRTPTGLHYLLVHYDIPHIEPDTWRMQLPGRTLSLHELRSMPAVTETVTLECAGNGRALLQPRPISQPWLTGAIGTAAWTGVRVADVIGAVPDDTLELVFWGADHGIDWGEEQDYARSLPLDEAMRSLIAYEMNGAPLEPQHGAPARLVVPGWYGMASVKWLTRIEAVAEPFEGYQNAVAYRFTQDADDPGVPVTRIHVRALLQPPGFPDFFTRHRIVDAGRVALSGRGWSGVAPVTRVEVGCDDVWTDAELGPSLGEFAWRSFTTEWDANPGEHVLKVRAHDASGAIQPDEPPWNRGGFANNAVQIVRVTVR